MRDETNLIMTCGSHRRRPAFASSTRGASRRWVRGVLGMITTGEPSPGVDLHQEKGCSRDLEGYNYRLLKYDIYFIAYAVVVIARQSSSAALVYCELVDSRAAPEESQHGPQALSLVFVISDSPSTHQLSIITIR